jgi:hypothetical protein
VLVLADRHDRTCAVAASYDMARRLPNAELVVFENSAHMIFAEEQGRFLAAVRHFLDRIGISSTALQWPLQPDSIDARATTRNYC